MKHRKFLVDVAIVILGIVLLVSFITWNTTSFAFAEGSAEKESNESQTKEHHTFNWWGFLGKMFDSFLLFGGLIFLIRKPLIALLAQKSEDVKSNIIEREELLDNKSAQLKGIMTRLEKIEDEIQDIMANASKSGNDEKKYIEELGKNEAQRILALTEEEIDYKIEVAVRNLKEKIADLTIDYFEKNIAANLDPHIHEQLIEKNIKLLSGDSIERK